MAVNVASLPVANYQFTGSYRGDRDGGPMMDPLAALQASRGQDQQLLAILLSMLQRQQESELSFTSGQEDRELRRELENRSIGVQEQLAGFQGRQLDIGERSANLAENTQLLQPIIQQANIGDQQFQEDLVRQKTALDSRLAEERVAGATMIEDRTRGLRKTMTRLGPKIAKGDLGYTDSKELADELRKASKSVLSVLGESVGAGASTPKLRGALESFEALLDQAEAISFVEPSGESWLGSPGDSIQVALNEVRGKFTRIRQGLGSETKEVLEYGNPFQTASRERSAAVQRGINELRGNIGESPSAFAPRVGAFSMPNASAPSAMDLPLGFGDPDALRIELQQEPEAQPRLGTGTLRSIGSYGLRAGGLGRLPMALESGELTPEQLAAFLQEESGIRRNVGRLEQSTEFGNEEFIREVRRIFGSTATPPAGRRPASD